MERRDFIKKLAIASGATLLLSSNVVNASALSSTSEANSTQTLEAPPLPWGYVELDPEYVRKLGHLGYYAFECGGGTFWAIMYALREKIGYPYTLVPIPSKEEVISALEERRHIQIPMLYGYGGVVGWGSLCGTLNGSASAVTLAVKFKKAKKIIRALLRWYESTLLPTDISNKYATNHEFFVPRYKTDIALPQTVSTSVLCHVSVARWSQKSGFASGSKERSERCARIAGDVAAKTVELLNASLKKGELKRATAFTLSQTTASCRQCHYKGKHYEKGQFARGFMRCESCHRDMRPHIAENKLRTAFGLDVGTWAKAAAIGSIAGIGTHFVANRLAGGKEDEDKE